MKITLHPMFEKLSGALYNIVCVTRKKELVDTPTNYGSSTYIRSKGRRQGNSIRQDNLQLAFKILVDKFKALQADTTAHQTWMDQAQVYEQLLGRYLTAYQLFLSYFMTQYTTTLSSCVKPVDLSPGLSLSWTDRNSRSWT
ncbi:MAG TPA: hypothetical protein ENI73_07215 [Spirochaetes bacterium]|nr:hypothetical protein [Spirochaetota bacterium]